MRSVSFPPRPYYRPPPPLPAGLLRNICLLVSCSWLVYRLPPWEYRLPPSTIPIPASTPLLYLKHKAKRAREGYLAVQHQSGADKGEGVVVRCAHIVVLPLLCAGGRRHIKTQERQWRQAFPPFCVELWGTAPLRCSLWQARLQWLHTPPSVLQRS